MIDCVGRARGKAQTVPEPGAVKKTSTQKENKSTFGAMLDERRTEIDFSKHARARAEERGIELTPMLLDKLAGSVERAQEKGAKNILAFDSTQAFIINIPHSRVVTMISQAEMRENIFTNIDGAVFL